ncbi:MAG: hypothetical protein VB071_04425 [Lawsonibacter sp.]|nr:hypothetical protein [Lawsonibacter sp.]
MHHSAFYRCAKCFFSAGSSSAFPTIYGGKGILSIELRMPLAALRDFHSPFVFFYQTHIGLDCCGEKMGYSLQEEKSGKLTPNAGVLAVVGDALVLTLNIKNPITFDSDVLGLVRATANPCGMTVTLTQENPPSIWIKTARSSPPF